ncbi:hypothetical protein M430DRAFT_224927 [Amorphotheca resinae ATCC 22711]|uniref:Uncharacterized protein n=1 Tax=Amorphotheca resinae ATCC 22711 TaxID=857342 RepID=A0A2T3B6K0_AMORE|nr:hypothetical protein M430DRAFT_224927 [Amorphotheca resinae ATCC 22711]PSS22384.1 hypothetical protein M430DRAFT_224927 [Amorphotheca resinae ATCC 22711]
MGKEKVHMEKGHWRIYSQEPTYTREYCDLSESPAKDHCLSTALKARQIALIRAQSRRRHRGST